MAEQTFRLPGTFPDVLKEYNALQKKQGFDLSDGLDFTDIAALFGGIEETKPKGRKSKNDGTALLGALLGLK